MRGKYFIKNEHTLGYLIPGSQFFHILHASVLRGATTDRLQTQAAYVESDLRPATRGDFNAYRVQTPKELEQC